MLQYSTNKNVLSHSVLKRYSYHRTVTERDVAQFFSLIKNKEENTMFSVIGKYVMHLHVFPRPYMLFLEKDAILCSKQYLQ